MRKITNQYRRLVYSQRESKRGDQAGVSISRAFFAVVGTNTKNASKSTPRWLRGANGMRLCIFEFEIYLRRAGV